MNALQLQYRHPALLTIVLMSCSIVLSTAAASVCLCLLVLIWLCDKQAKSRWQFYFQYPLTPPILSFITVTLVGMLYSCATWDQSLSTFNHTIRLGIIPMLAYYLQANPSVRKWIMLIFISALLFTIFCTCLKVYFNIPIGQRTYGNDVFKNHIVTSYFTAMGLFMVTNWFVQYKNYQIINGLLIITMLFYLVFLNTGRIGYVILGTSFSVFAWHHYRFKGLLISCLLLAGVMLLAYQCSTIFSMRMTEFYVEFLAFVKGTTVSSIGKRLEFLQNSILLLDQHPLLGYGTGSFAAAYHATFAGATDFLTDNPHNQYLKTGIELGLFGIVSLLWIFSTQWKMTRTLSNTEKVLAQGFLLSFFIGCFFNSWFEDFTELLFYCLMSACLLPASIQLGRQVTHKVNPLNAISPNIYP